MPLARRLFPLPGFGPDVYGVLDPTGRPIWIDRAGSLEMATVFFAADRFGAVVEDPDGRLRVEWDPEANDLLENV